MTHSQTTTPRILVTGGSGKTGRRVADRLAARGVDVRIASRRGAPSLDWSAPATWAPALEGVGAVYLAYAPDLAVPGALDVVGGFVDAAKRAGVRRVVLLSGRGEAEAQAAEAFTLDSGFDARIVRAAWFAQNFSEGPFASMVASGSLAFPDVAAVEPFVDLDDLADVAVAALTRDGLDGEVFEVTGPRLMSFADVAADLSRATGREIAHVAIPHAAFVDGVRASGASDEVVWLMDYLFREVLDGRNAHLADGVERALGRPPRDFAAFARDAAAAGAWRVAA